MEDVLYHILVAVFLAVPLCVSMQRSFQMLRDKQHKSRYIDHTYTYGWVAAAAGLCLSVLYVFVRLDDSMGIVPLSFFVAWPILWFGFLAGINLAAVPKGITGFMQRRMSGATFQQNLVGTLKEVGLFICCFMAVIFMIWL